MKAKYILAALDAMRAADTVLKNCDATLIERYRAADKLFDTRLDLKEYSGLTELEVPIEKESA